MNVAEEYVKFCVQYILENNMADLEYFQAEQIRRAKEEKKPQPKIKLLENLTNVVESKFKRITYEEAINICIKVSLRKKYL
jgi:asparaginyl-tRNA synthetase